MSVVTRPTVTSNSRLALGHLLGFLRPPYEPLWADAERCEAIVRNADTGNEYRVRVEQISGRE